MPDEFRKLQFWRQSSKIGSISDKPKKLKVKLLAENFERPIQLDIAGRILRLYPEIPIGIGEKDQKDWILIDEEQYFQNISGFIRIKSGRSVLIGYENKLFQQLFASSRGIKNRHLNIRNTNGRLEFSQLDPDADTTVNYVDVPGKDLRPVVNRRNNLEQIRHIFGGPINLLSPEQSLVTIRKVNQIVGDNRYRMKNKLGLAGGLVTIPDELTPIIVGDLHTQIDNLLKILSEGNYLSSLSRGKACLILLGDTIHSEVDGFLEEMDSSALILDLIFKLIIHFQDNLIYLRGNHESFAEDAAKSGIPQGLLFRKWLRDQRGQDYVNELEHFFEILPYVVNTSDFIVCHGGPPRGKITIQDLVNISDRPDLKHALTWNRFKSQRDALGYRKKDVKHFRKALGVEKKTPFIVGHNPLSQAQSFWLEAGSIPNHHIVYSANLNNLAVFTRVGKHILPFEYPCEHLLAHVNNSESLPAETTEGTNLLK